jgi:hypothetical protein
VPIALHCPQPAGFPSLQVTPVRAVQLVVLVPGVHCWHGFIGLMAFAA